MADIRRPDLGRLTRERNLSRQAAPAVPDSLEDFVAAMEAVTQERTLKDMGLVKR